MKTLHLIRHAKSSWSDPALADMDRPLNARGKKACKVMAPAIQNTGCTFQTIFCSSARRARQTIELIAAALPNHSTECHLDDELYTFNAMDLLNWCQRLDKALDDIVIVGHNPAITEFCNYLGDIAIDNIPTCGYVQLHCHCESWLTLNTGCAETVTVLTPKTI